MPERFSWILPNRLAVGSFPQRSTSVALLRRLGVTAVLSLTEEAERTLSEELMHNFVWERVPIPDGFTGGIPTENHFAQALQILTRWHRKGHVIYVHCLAGVGRSASVCAAYIAQTEGMSLDEAIAYVKQHHAYAAPDAHQVRVMQSFLQLSASERGD